MIYHSKVDPMKPTVLILLIGSFFAMGLIVLIGTGSLAGLFILIVGPAVLALVLLLVAWPMTYDPGATRSDGEPVLRVRGGRLLRYEIPIAGISEVRPTNSVLSSMSWSYDRIEVVSRSLKGYAGSLMISPRNRDAFLDELAGRAGHLVREGDRLTRRQDAHAAP